MELHFYDELPSTNDAAIKAAREGAEEFYTVVAGRQTAGRGRMARSFFSPEGGTYFSTVLRPRFPLNDYGAITPMVATAVHKAISRVTGVVTDIKWVNDLQLSGKKVCGILSQSGTDQNGDPFVVVGIGINTARVAFPDELREIADFIPCRDRTALIGAILAELAAYEDLIKRAAWLSHYREYCVALGRTVAVIEGERVRCGVALDVLSNGALRVQFANGGVEELRGGEISLRLSQDCEF